MLNLLRLIRRKEHIDDVATAYIEGRATERDEAAIAARASAEPGLKRDLDSIRDTVALLRAIEPAKAPRSFLLREAPVRVRRASRPRLATIPAAFAIAAAAMVALLAMGNLTNLVHQSDGSSASSESAMFSRTADDATTGSIGDPGSTGVAGGMAPESSDGLSQSAATTTTENAALAPEPSVPITGGDAATDGGAAGFAPPGTSEPDSSMKATIEGTPDESSGVTSDDASTALPLPEASVSAGIGGTNSDTPSFEQTPEKPGDGFALPLWQLQLGFAFLAVVMAGAWMILQRRLTR